MIKGMTIAQANAVDAYKEQLKKDISKAVQELNEAIDGICVKDLQEKNEIERDYLGQIYAYEDVMNYYMENVDFDCPEDEDCYSE